MNYPKRHWLFFCLVVIILTVIFNFRLLISLYTYDTSTIPVNDAIVTEFTTETEYQNLRAGKNVFMPSRQILYPFGTRIFDQDPSTQNLIPLLFLRPFLDIHQATIIIVLSNIVLANILMYALLRKMNIGWYPAFIGSLVYGFSPFLSYRILGHYTYTTYYFFPLLVFIAAYYLQITKNSIKIPLSIAWGVSWALLFYANPYYFVMAVLALMFLMSYYLITETRKLRDILATNIRNFLISATVFLVMLSPWISVYKNQSPSLNQESPSEIIRSVILSADMVNFVVPSEFNPLYDAIFDQLVGKNAFFTSAAKFFEYNWDRFAYPGIIVLVSYLLFGLFYKKLPDERKKRMLPFALVGIFFAVLSMGPFLKIFNRWSVLLPENITAYFPLPYLTFHFMPFFENLTAPARFVTALAFFGSILSAFVLDNQFNKLKKKHIMPLFIAIFLIFLIDQMYSIPNRPDRKLPVKAYAYISRSSSDGVVLEVPFTVRDGLRYIGDVHAIHIMRGAVMHGRPIIGGYMPRIDPSIFDYYGNLPFIGHVAKIIDKGNFHPYKERPNDPNVTPFGVSVDTMDNEIEKLNIEFILLKKNEPYTKLMQDTLMDLKFTEMMTDSGYTLYEKN